MMVTSIDQIKLRLKKCPAVFFLQTQEHTLVGRSDPPKTVDYNLVVTFVASLYAHALTGEVSRA